MKLSEEEKAERKRARMLENWKKYTIGTVKNIVAADFQQMVRAEAGAEPEGYTFAIIGGTPNTVWRNVGQIACVTCGRVGPWKGDSIGGGLFDTGHFVASRGASIIFEESNVAVQCKHCNRNLGGNQSNYRSWIENVYGPDEPDRLVRLKSQPKQFSKEELVDLRIDFMARSKAAQFRIETYI